MMPYILLNRTGLTSISGAARLAGITITNFWRLVKDRRAIPEPKTKVGNRVYYNAAEMAEVLKCVRELKKEKRVK
jgi:hypothetical protein